MTANRSILPLMTSLVESAIRDKSSVPVSEIASMNTLVARELEKFTLEDFQAVAREVQYRLGYSWIVQYNPDTARFTLSS